VAAPDALSKRLEPLHILLLAVLLMFGIGFTVKTMVCVVVHPEAVPVTVYVVVFVGVAVNDDAVVEDKPVAGDHE
jgi:hypothetical protein